MNVIAIAGEDVSPKHDGSILRSKMIVSDTYSMPNDGASVESKAFSFSLLRYYVNKLKLSP